MRRVAAGSAAGLLVGFFLSRALTHAPGRPPAPDAPPVASTPVLCRAALSREDLDEIKRAVAGGASAPTVPAMAAAPVPPPSPEDALRATALIDRALAAGEWRDEDAAELRRLVRTLSPEDGSAAIASLMAAINGQRLRLATQRPI